MTLGHFVFAIAFPFLYGWLILKRATDPFDRWFGYGLMVVSLASLFLGIQSLRL